MKTFQTALKLGAACMMAGALLAAGGTSAQAAVTVCPNLNGVTGDLLPWQIENSVSGDTRVSTILTFTASVLTSEQATSCTYRGRVDLGGTSQQTGYIPSATYTFLKATELNPNGVVLRRTIT